MKQQIQTVHEKQTKAQTPTRLKGTKTLYARYLIDSLPISHVNIKMYCTTVWLKKYQLLQLFR